MKRFLSSFAAVRCGTVYLAAMICLAGSSGCGPSGRGSARPSDRLSQSAVTVTVAAASSLRSVLDEIIDAFSGERSEVQVRVVYGSSGRLHAQILRRAPFDLFLSASRDYPESLVANGVIERGKPFCYARGQLAVLWRNGVEPSAEQVSLRILTSRSVRRLAIPNPRFAPYGRAAWQAMDAAGILDQVQDRIVFAENAAQAAHFVTTGAADAAITSLSLVGSVDSPARQPYRRLPQTVQNPVDQYGIIPDTCEHRDTVERFIGFLLGQRGQQILLDHGFLKPEG